MDYVILYVLAEFILRIAQVIELCAVLRKKGIFPIGIIHRIWVFNYFSLITIFGVSCSIIQFGLPDILFEY